MTPAETAEPPVVTLAALYGTGGAAVGRRVAERLGVEFLDRPKPADAFAAADDRPRSRVDRLVSNLARVADARTATADPVERVGFDEHRLRGELEAFLVRSSREGGVVLGRGGAVVLASVQGALHVYLGGPRDGRVERVMDRERVERAEAEHRVDAHDRARREYVRDFYGVDGDDPGLYHLMLDALALGLEGCVELIVLASGHRAATGTDTRC